MTFVLPCQHSIFEQWSLSKWWLEPDRKAPAPEQDAFQLSQSEGTRLLSASLDIN
jgi:hypothetical protein